MKLNRCSLLRGIGAVLLQERPFADCVACGSLGLNRVLLYGIGCETVTMRLWKMEHRLPNGAAEKRLK